MLDVSNEIIQMYHDDNPPAEIVLTIDGVEYGARNILSGSVVINESFCSGELFDLSTVEKNSLEFTFINIDHSITDLNGKTVVAVHRLTLSDNSTYDLPLGTFYIADAQNDGDYLYKCIAYDGMTKFDRNIDDWWNNQLTFPATIYDIAVSLCNYCGISPNFGNDFANANMVIRNRPTYFEGVKGTEVIGYIQETCGAFLKCDRHGNIKLFGLYGGLLPAEDLFPSETLYPASYHYWSSDVSHVEEYTYRYITGDFTVADYEVAEIDKVTVRNSENDSGTSWGTGTNSYVIEANPLFYNLDGETLTQAVRDLYNILHGIAYHPFQAAVKCLPYLEVGDWVQIHTLEGKTALSPLFSRSMHGAHIVFDTLECKGREYREEVKSVSRDIKILNRRTHEIINNVGELSSTLTEVIADVEEQSTQIRQTSEEISLLAKRTGYQNYITNGDFSDITNPSNGWILFTAGGTCEVVDDARFPSGKAIHFVQGTSGSAFPRYDIDFGEEVELYGKKICFYTKVEAISSSYSTGNLYMRIRGKKPDGTWTNLYTGAIICRTPSIVGDVKATYTPSQSMVVTALQFLPLFSYTGNTGEGYVSNVCAIIVNSDEETPERGFYTDLASNNLISQINIAPEGIKIQGEKVDIYGVTTFHNSDGTGGTTITGSTIRSATIETATLTGINSVLTVSLTRNNINYSIDMLPATSTVRMPSGEQRTYNGVSFSSENGSFYTDVNSVYLSSDGPLSLNNPNFTLDIRSDEKSCYFWEKEGNVYKARQSFTDSTTNIYSDYWNLVMGDSAFFVSSTITGELKQRIYLTSTQTQINGDTISLIGDLWCGSNGYASLKAENSQINYLSFSSVMSVYVGNSGYANKTMSIKGFKATDGNTYYIPCLTI